MSDETQLTEGDNRGRRWFLTMTGAVGLAWIGAAAYPVLRYLSPIPQPDPFGDQGRAAVKGLSPAQVAAPGSGANAGYATRGVIVFRTRDGELRAFDSKCTHAGCNVNFAGDKIVCHCHGGQYNLEGRNIAGPPPKPLTPLKITEENGVFYVSPIEKPAKAKA